MEYLATPPGEEATDWDRMCWSIAQFLENGITHNIIIFIIVVNAIFLGIQADQGNETDQIWMWMETGFVIFFTVEVFLKLVSFGYLFWLSSWNILDFVIILVALIELTLSFTAVRNGSSGIAAIRLLRVFRILRMFTVVESLNRRVKAFIYATKASFWVGLFLLVITYMCGIILHEYLHDRSKLLTLDPRY